MNTLDIGIFPHARAYANNRARLTIVFDPFVEIDIYVDPHAPNIYSMPRPPAFSFFGGRRQEHVYSLGEQCFIGSAQSWGAMFALNLASAYKPIDTKTICPFAMDDGALS